MAVGVGVIAGGQLEVVLVPDQRGHRIGGGAIHPDLAVGVERHETPGRVDLGVDDGEVQTELVGDVAPELHRGTTHGVGADLDAGLADRVQVDRVLEVGAVGGDVVEALDRALGLVIGHPLDAGGVSHQLVGAIGDPLGGVGVGWATVGRVVLEATIARWVVRGGDDDAVGLRLAGVVPVVDDDRAADGRGRCVVVLTLGQHVDTIGDEHLGGGLPRREAQRVGVLADEQRPVGALGGAVLDDRLRGGGDVQVVELLVQAGATMARGAEDDLLVDVRGVGGEVVVGLHDLLDLDEVLFLGRLSCALMCHGTHLALRRG